jgi:aerobic-type carbon monoxide dehydrogenase small subunit (CoxS/CutS family)
VSELELTCNGTVVRCTIETGESLLSVLRDHLHLTGVKDGCAPQGQCGCCTVLVDGEARVACVTPAARVAGRTVTTVEGLSPEVREPLADALCAAGGSQCGFCTPGIVVRAAALRAKGRPVDRAALDRALAAHLCRCTGWQTIVDALVAADPTTVDGNDRPVTPPRDLQAARRRAELETGGPQRVGPAVALGEVAFADDTAPTGALVAVPRPAGSTADAIEAAGVDWVVAESLHAARAAAGKVQGRRTTLVPRPPLGVPDVPRGGVALATSWVEPAYLECDASWCRPGGEPADPLANGGAFGGKIDSLVPRAARELADRLERTVRVVFAREDVVRWGPKRSPIAGTARLADTEVQIELASVATIETAAAEHYGLSVVVDGRVIEAAGPPVGRLRAPWAETAVLVEGALHAAGVDRAGAVRRGNAPELAGAVLLDTCVASPDGAYAGARVELDADRITGIELALAAGDPLDAVVLRSYAIGAAHMALGWVLTEGLTVDPDSGDVHDLTIRSFGIVRPRDMPPIEVHIVDDARPPVARASDAAFAAVAAATWIALGLPAAWPALDHPVARRLRR